ncbi:unnamed protein product [Diatraea saccharalis]|uniref:unspecific monooxygenase n=1 Tax=Diatraea saccharalis TaxID=40085 RepID=A0A9N9R4T5_9NEOP|nr:unnamed protein product [Diatraea saccharalis]CAG9789581.1 unnamed protein product [Diatraea saccharalis]
MSLNTILTFLATIVVLIYYYLKKNKTYWKKLGIISPKSHILFGNFKEVILRQTTFFHQIETFYNMYPNEKFIGLYRFNTPVLLIRDLDIVQHICVREFDSYMNRGIEFGDKLKNNLASSKDDTWRMLRSRFSPLFTSGKLKNMLHLINSCGDKTLEYLETLVSQSKEHDILDITKKYSVGSISACAFGLDLDMKNPDEKLTKMETLAFTNFYTLELIFLCPGLIKKLGISIAPKEISVYFCNLVNFIKKQRDRIMSSRKDFMDLLLEMKNSTELKSECVGSNEEIVTITDELIAAQAMIFYVAGFDTTANTLSFLLYEVAKHQDIQEKMLKEIKQVLADNDGEISLEILKQLTYMDQVYDETLRMYPIAGLQRRVSVPSCKLLDTSITLKRDAIIYVSVRGIHYNEQYYPDPYKFDPERFSPENKKSRHPCAYIPFGFGPRHCIGMRFAKVQARVFLIKFLSCYKVELAADTKEITYDTMKITLTAKDGIPLKITRRN